MKLLILYSKQGKQVGNPLIIWLTNLDWTINFLTLFKDLSIILCSDTVIMSNWLIDYSFGCSVKILCVWIYIMARNGKTKNRLPSAHFYWNYVWVFLIIKKLHIQQFSSYSLNNINKKSSFQIKRKKLQKQLGR